MKVKLPNSEFSRNVLTLMTGTTVAQAIPIAVSPILTRIYSPQDFGVFALFFSVTSVFSVIVTGRYEQVVMLPQRDEDAANVAALSIVVSFLCSLIVLFVMMIGNVSIAELLGNQSISCWLYFIPISIFLMGTYNTINCWLNRQKQFKTMSTNRVMQGTITATGQLSLGSVITGPTGLVTGFVGGWLVATIMSLRSCDYKAFRVRWSSIVAHAKLYKDYPLLGAPGALLDCASMQAPVFFLTKGYEAATVGFFGLAMRAISAPSSIISTSIGQVFFQKITVLIYREPEKIRAEVLRTAFKLVMIATVAFVPFLFFGDKIFSFTFGEKWRLAGQYVQIMSPALLVRFVVSPLSTIFPASGNVRLSTLWQVLYFISTVVVMWMLLGQKVTIFLTGLVINEIIMYSLYFYFIMLASKRIVTR